MLKNDETKYLSIDGEIVAFGSEADMINLAAQYDSDYELLEEPDLSDVQAEDVKNLLGEDEEE